MEVPYNRDTTVLWEEQLVKVFLNPRLYHMLSTVNSMFSQESRMTEMGRRRKITPLTKCFFYFEVSVQRSFNRAGISYTHKNDGILWMYSEGKSEYKWHGSSHWAVHPPKSQAPEAYRPPDTWGWGNVVGCRWPHSGHKPWQLVIITQLPLR